MATDDKDRVAQGTVLIPPGLRLCPSSACFFWACCRGGRRRGVDAEMLRTASVPFETAEGEGGDFEMALGQMQMSVSRRRMRVQGVIHRS